MDYSRKLIILIMIILLIGIVIICTLERYNIVAKENCNQIILRSSFLDINIIENNFDLRLKDDFNKLKNDLVDKYNKKETSLSKLGFLITVFLLTTISTICILLIIAMFYSIFIGKNK